MILHNLISIRGLPVTVLDIATWPDLEPSHLKPQSRVRYDRFKLALIRVVRDRFSISAAARDSGVDRSELDRVLARCLTLAPDGNIEGFRALSPYRRLKTYQRSAMTVDGTAGLFSELMDQFPEINEELWQAHLRGESNEQIKKLLLEELLPKEGWPRHKYPYNTARKAAEALRHHLKRLERKAAAGQWAAEGPNEERRVIVRPFECVQLDAHRCDAHFVIHLEGPEGLSRTLVLERIWLLVLIDVGSRAVLGYALSFNRQCTISDVLEAIHTAIVPQPPRTITIPGLEYKAGAGFPNYLIPMCAWQKMDLICLDNAMAHRSPRLHQILSEKVQCAIRLNRAGTPNDNQFIERFYATLTAHGCKRTVSSTGSGPKDPKRTDSEKMAVHYEFAAGDGEQFLDVVTANYNVEMHGGIYASPLDYLRTYYREVPALTRIVPLSERNGWSLRELWDEATVRNKGGAEGRPFIRWLGAEYRGDFLLAMPELIGKPVLLLVSVDDLRALKVYSTDGRELGVFHVCGRWALTKHSLKTRQLILRLVREGVLQVGYQDPVRVLKTHLEERAKTNKAERNQLARLVRDMGEQQPAITDKEDGAKHGSFEPNREDWISLRTPVYD